MGELQAWRCLEVDCDYAAVGADEDAIVAAAADHARVAHDSFELEEMILAALEPVDAPPPGYVAVGAVHVPAAWAERHDVTRLDPDARRSMEWSPERGYPDV
jgi:predicted small metal-binding protein